MLNIAVLVSGGGTNLQALIDDGINISAVISSKQGAYALERAKKAGIATYVIARKDYNDREAYSDALLSLLKELKADLIVLAGFMCVLSGEILREYKNRIINVHPSLIPSFCGDGYYGLRVHEAALNKGVKITGATVHFVNAVTDGGPIILQKAVEVYEGDTPVTLQKRVMEQAEWEILPRAVRLFCGGRLTVENGIVHIKEE
jgi:phosphoribosylglycinamide formyltransferase-1